MADNEQMSFEFIERKPIKGYPELHWTGKRPYKSTVYYPAQLKEVYGEAKNDWLNKIFWGDNLQVMSHLLKDYRGKIDLIYIDPPFDSKADYRKKIKLKGKTIENDSSTFEEKQYGDIWTNDEYLQFMYERLTLIRELLADTGVVYVHCDHRRMCQIRLMMDEIFGVDSFLNNITWRRQIVRGMKTHARYYAFSSDYIIIYEKCKGLSTWNRQVKENLLTIADAEKKYNKDDHGYFRTSDPGSYTFESLVDLNNRGLLYAPKNGQIIVDYENRTIIASNGGKPAVKYYREQRGNKIVEEITIDNIWEDIPGMGIVSSEFIDYPTQKPEALLERIIKASSNPGDIVFDCFMGSGTTQAVAMKLGRRFIGADINLGAIQTTTKRLINVANGLNSQIESEDKYTGFEVYNVNNYDLFRNPVEARDLILQALEVQPYETSNVYDGEKDGRMVKIMPVNRIATKADLQGILSNLPYKQFERIKEENPGTVVLKLTLVCMGHESDLAAALKQELSQYKTDIDVVDILHDRADLQFKRDSEADIVIEGNELVIKNFYPLNLMQKLSLDKETVDEWRQLVESVMIDFNYDGAVIQPTTIDLPDKDKMVVGRYKIPSDAGIIRVKITDVLSESLEVEVQNG